MRSEMLAVRAVNQYRRRDMFAYLGLRYYLENSAAKKDLWAANVSSYLVLSRQKPAYFRSHHFKEVSEQGGVNYRNIYLPGPNEILAETKLLHTCSLYSSFKSRSCVYSYHFSALASKEGVFGSYFPRYMSRHQSIAEHCQGFDNLTVRYTDIRKYYPSIDKELAQNAWKTACDNSNIDVNARILGERLLDDHFRVSSLLGEGLSILTGPMFSHLIANLVLFQVDELMYEKTNGRYWRYVDDIVMVGENEEVDQARAELKTILGDLGFSLHEEEKDFAVDSKTWLEGINDFNDVSGKLWMNLIANIKRFLLAKPELRDDLIKSFLDHDINIPLLDYSVVASEASFVERIKDFLNRYSWFSRSITELSINKLLQDALMIKSIYQEDIANILSGDSKVEGYRRKRLLSKLRFYAGRLFYLASPDALSDIGNSLASYPEMLLEAAVMQALRTRDVTLLLKFGANAVQAAAQVMRLRNEPVLCSLDKIGEVELQGIALLKLNGINLKIKDEILAQVSNDPLNNFADGINMYDLMRSNDPFIQEIACLRGFDNTLKHHDLLDTAFDRDEQLVFDVINQLKDSSYF